MSKDALDLFMDGKTLFLKRGSAALLLGMRAAILATGRKEIIVPPTVCISVPLCAHLAGAIVRYADISPITGCLLSESVSELISDNTAAVVGVHAFGNGCSLDLLDITHNAGALYLEDVAQALGGKYPSGEWFGSIGDLCIASFLPGKIITLEKGGGALSVKNKNLVEFVYNAFTQYADIKSNPIDDSVENWIAWMQRGVENLWRACKNNATNVRLDYPAIATIVRSAYIGGSSVTTITPSGLINECFRLSDQLYLRCRSASIVREILNDLPNFRFISQEDITGCCWRLTAVSDNPDAILNGIHNVRSSGFDISGLYFSCALTAGSEDKTPNANSFGMGVVNFWINPGMASSVIEECAAIFRRFYLETING